MLPVFATNVAYAILFGIAFAIWILPEMVRSFTRKRSPDIKSEDRMSGVVLITCIWVGNWLAFQLAYSAPRLAIPWQRTLLFGIGILFMLAGVVFRAYSIRVLGKYFTTVVAIQPGQTVTRTGPYRYIRHPSYSGALLTILGIGLAIGNWLGLIVLLFFAALGYGYRIMVEEKTLMAELGEPYREYMRHTKRIIPFVI